MDRVCVRVFYRGECACALSVCIELCNSLKNTINRMFWSLKTCGFWNVGYGIDGLLPTARSTPPLPLSSPPLPPASESAREPSNQPDPRSSTMPRQPTSSRSRRRPALHWHRRLSRRCCRGTLGGGLIRGAAVRRGF
jgi:hypothetical protein